MAGETLRATGAFGEIGGCPDSEWDSIARLGFDIVWLMGVWKRSPESRRIKLANPANIAEFDSALPGWKPEDVIGSPYSVAQYVPDERIGTWESLDEVRAKFRERGIALFLDFVGNHTALDHPGRAPSGVLCTGRAEDFEQDPANFYRIETPRGVFFPAFGRDPYFPPWDDVAQLNHFSPQMRATLIGDLRTIAGHCDGVRCDMAMLHLTRHLREDLGPLASRRGAPQQEFWAKATPPFRA